MFTFLNYVKLIGKFNENYLLNGVGKLYCRNTLLYEGSFLNGYMSGIGTLYD